MLSPKALEAWFTLIAEAMRGTKEAQEAFRALSEMPANSEEFSRWMARFMPAAVSSTANFQPEAVEAQLEEWWRMMGVVPRSRYLELLERCDTLQRQLDRAEATIKELRARLSGRDKEGEATQKAMDMWSAVTEEMLRGQIEWMKTWTATPERDDSEADNEEHSAPDETGDVRN